MNRTAARLITWTGGGAILAAAATAVVFHVLMGEAVFAARLIAGLAGCL